MNFFNHLIFGVILLITIFSTTCSNTTKPPIEPTHVCNDEFDLEHEAILVAFHRELTYEEIEEFVTDYEQYGARINYALSPDFNEYFIGFDHSKIHCVLFHLKILNDERVYLTLLFWYNFPTTYDPGYMTVRFRENVTDSDIKEFILKNEIYEVKLYNVLVPLRKRYLFTYNHEKLLRIYDIYDEDIMSVMGIDRYYHTLIDPIKQ